MTREIVYDLTEVLLASTGKLRYYGIVRVVAEVAREMMQIDPQVRYCIHSPAFDAFFEVKPVSNPDGSVDLAVPTGFRQFRLRKHFYRPNLLRDALMPALRAAVFAYNRRIWRNRGVDLRVIDMSGKVYVSCARPKLIADAIDTLKRRADDWQAVPLLHDMIPLHDYFDHRQRDFPTNFIGDNRYVIENSALLLANSAFTRDEITTFAQKGHLPTPPKTVPIPLVHECPDGDEPSREAPPDEPFILTVGAATGRKNLEVVFEAMLLLREAGKPVPVLCLAGALRKRTREYFEGERFAPIRDRIAVRANPNQTDLVALYRNAVALVIPSRMEGWGLPAGEALWLGTPAICSTAQVFREVCGELGLYFDPDRPAELAAKLDRLMHDAEFSGSLRARIDAAKPRLRRWSDVASDIHATVTDAFLRGNREGQGNLKPAKFPSGLGSAAIYTDGE